MKILALTVLLPFGVACPQPAVEADSTPVPPPVVESKGNGEFDQTHALWTEILKANVKDDRFDYAALKRDRVKLDDYLGQLHAVTPEQLESWTREQRFAFWIDVYNASVVELIVDEYPLESIQDLGSLLSKVWDKEIIPMRPHHPKGKDDDLSLNDVEHEILRPRFEDARVHAAINCASIGCPPLRDEAFVAARLEQQLDEQMRAFVADARRNELDREDDELRLSSIFNWFEEDFERDEGSVRAYVRKYAPGEDTGWILKADVEFRKYDWGLNDVEQEGR